MIQNLTFVKVLTPKIGQTCTKDIPFIRNWVFQVLPIQSVTAVVDRSAPEVEVLDKNSSFLLVPPIKKENENDQQQSEKGVVPFFFLALDEPGENGTRIAFIIGRLATLHQIPENLEMATTEMHKPTGNLAKRGALWKRIRIKRE